MNDLSAWLHSSVEKAIFFLTDLTRKPRPDLVAIVEKDHQFVKGVIIESVRQGDVGAIWWTTRDDVQVGLEMGYFDISKEKPVLRLVAAPAPAKTPVRSVYRSRDQGRGRSR